MKTRASAIAGSAAFFLVAPCIVAGLLPWLVLDRYETPLSGSLPQIALGMLLIVVAIAVLVHCFTRFALEGLGTPAPIAPTERLVASGAYRFVRNPMYVAVLSIIAGQAMVFGSWPVLLYAIVVAAAVVSFVRLYEEPTLTRRHGAQYEAYRRAVPAWLPRLTPWPGD